MKTSNDRVARLRVLALACSTAALAALSACGGGGGGSPAPSDPGAPAPSPGSPPPPPPPAPTYTVGGSIAGLTTDGLALTDGLSTMQVPSGTSTFTFPESFASGSSYTVSVATQPFSRAQTCSVTGGSGTLASADVTSVGVDCHATLWGYTLLSGGVVATLGAGDYVDGAAAAATYSQPSELVYAPDGMVYVADTGNFAIRRVAPDGSVDTLAGGGGRGFVDGVGGAARFDQPRGITLGPDGNLYVADFSAVRQVRLDGTVTTIAGKSGEPGDVVGPALDARFWAVRALRFDKQGTLYMLGGYDAALGNGDVRKLVNGVVSIVAGGLGDEPVDGRGTNARFVTPNVMEIDRDGNLLVGDNTALRKVTPAGEVTTLVPGIPDDPGCVTWPVTAPICWVSGLWADPSGYVFVADGGGSRVLAYSPAGQLSTLYQASNVDGSDPRNQFSAYGLLVDTQGAFVMSNQTYDPATGLETDGLVRLMPQ